MTVVQEGPAASREDLCVDSHTLVGLSEEIGDLIRSLREARGLSQSELARRLEIAPAQISQIEAGYYTPSLQVLESMLSELEAHLCIELDEGGLVTGASSRPDEPPAQETR